MNGSLALVGSGEYLPAMAEFEKSLVHDGVKNGKEGRYIQIPTAAGRENADRLSYWKDLGLRQAKAIGVEATYLPIYRREDAFNQEFVDAVANIWVPLMSDTLNWYVSPGIREFPKINSDCRLNPICGSVYDEVPPGIKPVDSSQMQVQFWASNTASASIGSLGLKFCASVIFLIVIDGMMLPETKEILHTALATSILFLNRISAVKMETTGSQNELAATIRLGFVSVVLKVIGTPWTLRHF